MGRQNICVNYSKQDGYWGVHSAKGQQNTHEVAWGVMGEGLGGVDSGSLPSNGGSVIFISMSKTYRFWSVLIFSQHFVKMLKSIDPLVLLSFLVRQN